MTVGNVYYCKECKSIEISVFIDGRHGVLFVTPEQWQLQGCE